MMLLNERDERRSSVEVATYLSLLARALTSVSGT